MSSCHAKSLQLGLLWREKCLFNDLGLDPGWMSCLEDMSKIQQIQPVNFSPCQRWSSWKYVHSGDQRRIAFKNMDHLYTIHAKLIMIKTWSELTSFWLCGLGSSSLLVCQSHTYCHFSNEENCYFYLKGQNVKQEYQMNLLKKRSWRQFRDHLIFLLRSLLLPVSCPIILHGLGFWSLVLCTWGGRSIYEPWQQ